MLNLKCANNIPWVETRVYLSLRLACVPLIRQQTKHCQYCQCFRPKMPVVNVRGHNKSIKRRTVFRWLHKQNHHVMFLQESYCSKELETIWENEWGGKAFLSHGTNHSKGRVLTLINPSVNFKVEKAIPNKQGRFIILKLSLEEKVIVLVNIYTPNDVAQQVAFFKRLN